MCLAVCQGPLYIPVALKIFPKTLPLDIGAKLRMLMRDLRDLWVVTYLGFEKRGIWLTTCGI